MKNFTKIALFSAFIFGAGSAFAAVNPTVSTDFKGFNVNNPNNLWKTADVKVESTYFATGNDWQEIAAPTINIVDNNISFTTPENTGYSQWQAQINLSTGIAVSTDNNYSFSMWADIDKEVNITVKLMVDDNNFFIGGTTTIIPGGGACVYFNDVPAPLNGNINLLFDVAGYPSTSFSFSDICFLESQYVENEAPEQPEEPEFEGYDYDSDANLWKNATIGIGETYFANNDWTQITSPDITLSNYSMSFTTPADMGYSQWQGQVKLSTNIPVEASESYDFCCYVDADVATKVTIKAQAEGTIGNDVYFEAVTPEFPAGGGWYHFSNLPGFDGTLWVVFDFAGYPDTAFTVNNFVFANSNDEVGTTAVDSIQSVNTTDSAVYSITGVKVRDNAQNLNTLPKGIYIFNGRKVIVK